MKIIKYQAFKPMKRAIFLILMLVSITSVSAQKGLNINQLFDGRYKDNSHATETIIAGNQLNTFLLDKYHALSITNDADAAKDIEPLVVKDGANAVSKEVSFSNGHLYYGFYQLKARYDYNRYIFYLNQTLKGGNKIIVMYLEGAASTEKIKQMLKNCK
jgi:hypothetical protein